MSNIYSKFERKVWLMLTTLSLLGFCVIENFAYADDLGMACAMAGDLVDSNSHLCLNLLSEWKIKKQSKELLSLLEKEEEKEEGKRYPEEITDQVIVLMKLAVQKANGHPEIVGRSYEILQKFLPGDDKQVPIVTDKLISLDQIISLVTNAHISAEFKAKLLGVTNKARAKILLKQNEEREDLVEFIAVILKDQRSKKPQLTSEQSSTLISEATGIIVYFDPVPLMKIFRKGLKEKNMKLATSVVIRSMRKRIAEEYDGAMSPEELKWIESIYTTNLEPVGSLQPYFRQYDFSTDETPSRRFGVIFEPDCDGVWRIRQI